MANSNFEGTNINLKQTSPKMGKKQFKLASVLWTKPHKIISFKTVIRNIIDDQKPQYKAEL